MKNNILKKSSHVVEKLVPEPSLKTEIEHISRSTV